MQHLKKSIHQNHQVSELINGDFSIEDALDVINNLISSKIDFHKRKDFSSQIRFARHDEHSVRRIEELIKCRGGIIDFLNSGNSPTDKVKIYSTISIQKIK